MNPQELREQSVEDAHSQLDDYYVIDVRFDHEMDGPLGSIAGAERIDRADLAKRVDALKDASLLVVCRSGRRSAAACEALSDLGHTDVTNLAGGMIAWNESGLPVARKRPGRLRELVDSVAHWFGMMTQKPHGEARAHLGVSDSDDPTPDEVHRALEAAAAHFEGDSAPPDLQRSLDVFHGDLKELKSSRGEGA